MSLRGVAAVLSALAIGGAAAPAAAQSPAPHSPPVQSSLVLLPTAVEGGGALRPPRADDGDLGRLAQSLDTLLSDTAQDLGLSVAPPPADARGLGDADLLDRARAAHALVLLPSLRATSTGDVEIRLALATPTATAADVRRERVPRASLALRAVVLLRNVVADRGRARPEPPVAPAPSAPAKLAGRITLMANATAFGGLVGFSIQRGSGSSDPRLLVPLVLVGAGIGLGASYLASGEWDVGTGDAWYFAAGAWWPTLAGHFIFQGRFAATRSDSDRWVFGLLGGGMGATIATLGLALHSMSDGDALVAHSGGGLGLMFGALAELTVRGDVHQVPFAGMGYGAGLGWLAAAALATQVHAPPLRVVAVDAGVALGGLVGAAIGSPLLVGNPSAGRQRAWAGITAGSALTAGVVAAVVVKPGQGAKRRTGMPLVGVIGESSAGTRSAPILGFGYAGSIEGLR